MCLKVVDAHFSPIALLVSEDDVTAPSPLLEGGVGYIAFVDQKIGNV